MQINLHEMSNPVFWEKLEKYLKDAKHKKG